MDYGEKLQRCHEHVDALEEEKRKIQVFRRELPLCLELVTQAIEACKKELSGTTVEYTHGQSESSEGFTRPLLEEFIPIKRTNSCSDGDEDENDDDQEHQSHNNNNKRNESMDNKDKNSTDHKKKSDWLRSVQLWNQSPDLPLKEDLPRNAVATEMKRNGGAFQPFHKEKSVGKSNQTIAKARSSVPASATSSTTEMRTGGTAGGGAGGGSSRKEEKESQTQRKQRRCWSLELHRQFLHALQQLGGSHTATPKQIRELMKVDGLTNDEVKSHLQKYRLHIRRPSPIIHNNNNPKAPQFVVVGGIWVPPPEYAVVAAATRASGETATITAAANGIYAPVAAPPPTVGPELVQKLQRAQSE